MASYLFLLGFALLLTGGKGQTFSAAEATVGWQIVNAAYCSSNTITAWTCTPCRNSGLALRNVRVRTAGGSQGFTGFDSRTNRVILAFRGSSNIQNWVNNIDTIRTDYPFCQGCLVHLGFYRAYLDIIAGIRDDVRAALAANAGSRLRIYGHSLGGALAVHAAADLFANFGIRPEFVYTFGQPRVGDTNFASWYGGIAAHFRVTHNRDMVPHVPPSFLGFRHSRLEIWYPGNPPSFRTCDGSGEDPTCSNSQTALSINDHLTYMGGSCCCSTFMQTSANMSSISQHALDEMIIANSNSLPAAPSDPNMTRSKSICSRFADCGSCRDATELGLSVCEWCIYQIECHDVGSIYNPCPSESCVSQASLSRCTGTCPPRPLPH